MNLVRWSVLGFCAMSLLAATFLTSALAGGDKDKVEPTKGTTASKETIAMQNAVAAYKMAKYGRDNNAPEALLAAARVIGGTKFTDLEPKEQKSGNFELANPVKDANAMLDEAVTLSKNNDAVKKLAETIRTEIGTRGAVGGPRTINGTVSQGDRRDTFSIRFRGGEQAFLIVNNLSNRGDIDLYIQDDNGRIVARDRRVDDDASVAFFVPRTQTYQVIVHCYRAPANTLLRYRLTTN